MGRLRRAGRRVPFDVAIASIFFALRAEGVGCDVREKGEKKKLSGRLQRDLGNGSVFRRGVRLYYIIGAVLHTPFSELPHRLN